MKSAILKIDVNDTADGQREPFQADFDPQGRLLEFNAYTTPKVWDITFTGYGTQQPPVAPAGAAALPTPVYGWIND